jgi:hypothetical protein
VAVEVRVGGQRGEDERAEGVDGDAEPDASGVVELHVGDDQAQEVDLQHRPGPIRSAQRNARAIPGGRRPRRNGSST